MEKSLTVQLSSLGEFGFINRFSQNFNKSVPVKTIGIGDDCASIPYNKRESILVTTDMLIEDRHFLRNKITPFELGYKSLAVNLSDIAAMGGRPHSAFLSIGIPEDVDLKWIDSFFVGLKEMCDKSNTLLLGGDTTSSPDKIVINIAVIGYSMIRTLKKRSTAKAGDIICVNDCTGDSGGGLKALINNLPLEKHEQYLVKRHHLPYPQLKEGMWLAEQRGVTAMIDISDGIESDIRRIMESSKVGANIYLDKIPVSEALRTVCKKYNWNILELALSAGEDYCLMVTIHKNEIERLKKNYFLQFEKPLYPIGEVTLNKDILNISLDGRLVDPPGHGFDHFKKYAL